MASSSSKKLDKPLLEDEESRCCSKGCSEDWSENTNDDLAVPEFAMWVLMAVAFLDAFSGTITWPIIPFYARSLGATEAEIGYVFALYSVSSSLLMPLCARLADYWGRRPTLLLSLLTSGGGSFMASWSPTLFWYYVAQVVSGTGLAIGTVTNTYVSDVAGSSAVSAKWYTRLGAIPGFALVLGPPTGGFLAGYRLSFPMFADGMVTWIGLFVAYFALIETPAFLKAKAAKERMTRSEIIQVTSSQREFMGEPEAIARPAWFIIVDGLNMNSGGFLNTLFLQQALLFNPQQTGVAQIGLAFSYLIMSLVVTPRMHQDVGIYKSLIAGSVCCSIANISMTLAPGLIPILFMYLNSVGNSLRLSTSPVILSHHAKTSNRATIFSTFQFAQSVGKVIGPVICGHLAAIDLRTYPFYFLMMLNLTSTVLISVGMYHDPQFETEAANDVGILNHDPYESVADYSTRLSQVMQMNVGSPNNGFGAAELIGRDRTEYERRLSLPSNPLIGRDRTEHERRLSLPSNPFGPFSPHDLSKSI